MAKVLDHIMIDLEALGTKQHSVFISIGACRFNPHTGEIDEKFYEHIDWDSAIKAERSMDASTIKWWLQQSDAARKEILRQGKPLKDVLKALGKWTRTVASSKVWGNGATFDISMLENAYDNMFGVQPWDFWNVRDVRTIVDLATGKISQGEMKFEGTQHNALDDAIHQAKYVSKMWQALRK